MYESSTILTIYSLIDFPVYINFHANANNENGVFPTLECFIENNTSYLKNNSRLFGSEWLKKPEKNWKNEF